MGVPRLALWLRTNFPDAIISFMYDPTSRTNYVVPGVDNLYIDGNPILHTCAQIYFNYGDHKSRIDRYKDLSYEEKEKKVYEDFFENIIVLTKIAKPKKFLYIVIDGPAPIAKQMQQRQRRYVASKDKKADDRSFSSTCITPGTTFMLGLTRYIQYRIRKEMMENAEWAKMQVVFSSAIVPGEGEHKIMQLIRNIPNFERNNLTHCIYGVDGDLIMLGLALHVPKIYLLRIDQDRPEVFEVFDMGFVRSNFPKILNTSLREAPLERIVNDFILTGFLVGNDFLPKIQMFLYLEDGLELMLDVYCRNKMPLTDPYGIIHKNFTSFVSTIAAYEEKYLLNQLSIEVKDSRLINHTLKKYAKVDKDTGKYISLDFLNYRLAYYAKAGIEGHSIGEKVYAMCIDYLRSMSWIYYYYIYGLKSWRYYYPWHYPPLITDLNNVMIELSKDHKLIDQIYKKFDLGLPTKPFVQLLCVIPPVSSHYLPDEYSSIMKNKELINKGVYPSTFEIDYEGKTREHMAIIKIPFVNVLEIEKIYEGIKPKKQYIRDAIGDDVIFIYDEKYECKYVSDYGTIDISHIKKL
jgi:5'-3' exoribonuclease 1